MGYGLEGLEGVITDNFLLRCTNYIAILVKRVITVAWLIAFEKTRHPIDSCPLRKLLFDNFNKAFAAEFDITVHHDNSIVVVMELSVMRQVSTAPRVVLSTEKMLASGKILLMSSPMWYLSICSWRTIIHLNVFIANVTKAHKKSSQNRCFVLSILYVIFGR